jgi:hypothetical protein
MPDLGCPFVITRCNPILIVLCLSGCVGIQFHKWATKISWSWSISSPCRRNKYVRDWLKSFGPLQLPTQRWRKSEDRRAEPLLNTLPKSRENSFDAIAEANPSCFTLKAFISILGTDKRGLGGPYELAMSHGFFFASTSQDIASSWCMKRQDNGFTQRVLCFILRNTITFSPDQQDAEKMSWFERTHFPSFLRLWTIKSHSILREASKSRPSPKVRKKSTAIKLIWIADRMDQNLSPFGFVPGPVVIFRGCCIDSRGWAEFFSCVPSQSSHDLLISIPCLSESPKPRVGCPNAQLHWLLWLLTMSVLDFRKINRCLKDFIDANLAHSSNFSDISGTVCRNHSCLISPEVYVPILEIRCIMIDDFGVMSQWLVSDWLSPFGLLYCYP